MKNTKLKFNVLAFMSTVPLLPRMNQRHVQMKIKSDMSEKWPHRHFLMAGKAHLVGNLFYFIETLDKFN